MPVAFGAVGTCAETGFATGFATAAWGIALVVVAIGAGVLMPGALTAAVVGAVVGAAALTAGACTGVMTGCTVGTGAFVSVPTAAPWANALIGRTARLAAKSPVDASIRKRFIGLDPYVAEGDVVAPG